MQRRASEPGSSCVKGQVVDARPVGTWICQGNLSISCKKSLIFLFRCCHANNFSYASCKVQQESSNPRNQKAYPGKYGVQTQRQMIWNKFLIRLRSLKPDLHWEVTESSQTWLGLTRRGCCFHSLHLEAAFSCVGDVATTHTSTGISALPKLTFLYYHQLLISAPWFNYLHLLELTFKYFGSVTINFFSVLLIM